MANRIVESHSLVVAINAEAASASHREIDDDRGGGITSEKIAKHQCGRLFPLPFSHDPTEAIDQAEAALIVHADETQRIALMLASLRLQSESDLAALFADLSEQLVGAGVPLPTFINLREEAADWARFATLEELRAYCGACLSALPDADVATLSAALARRAAS